MMSIVKKWYYFIRKYNSDTRKIGYLEKVHFPFTWLGRTTIFSILSWRYAYKAVFKKFANDL